MPVGHNDISSKCGRRNVVDFKVEPPDAFRTVVLNRWRIICPTYFDAEAQKAGVRYQFVGKRQTWYKPEDFLADAVIGRRLGPSS